MKNPNLIFVFADQLRYQALGFAGDPNVRTPYLDRLAEQSLNFTTAISGCPVCSPARASIMTGQYPLTHGVFVNDVYLQNRTTSLAQALKQVGYKTAYIGKWHLDGHGRSSYIPPDRRQGFDFWMALECTHRYNQSAYYAGNDPAKRIWGEYDAIAQTKQAQKVIRENAEDGPFLLMLSWGPPHNPYQTAPETYRRRYDPQKLSLRPNVPSQVETQARDDLAGYYAHVNALDDCIGGLMKTIEECGIEEETISVFWSDHGDMHGSQGQWRKQRPWDESIRVPLLIRYPAIFGNQSRHIEVPINTPDLMPTLLALCGAPIPETVEGINYAPYLNRATRPPADAALIACYHPFGEFTRQSIGREYRGIRTGRYTYVRDIEKPWLLYDNMNDPYQMNNLINQTAFTALQAELESKLNELLNAQGDEFLPGDAYIRKWGYITDENGTVPYTE
ncbi:sulfatase [candidate division KSB1 bacterium]|nr:sulfatase [candidate division KSB1 bacterium]